MTLYVGRARLGGYGWRSRRAEGLATFGTLLVCGLLAAALLGLA